MTTLALSRTQLKQSLHRDIRLMLPFYISGVDRAIPDMHCELWDELVTILDKIANPQDEKLIGILRKLLAIPRGHAKTTLIKLACVLFLRYSKLSFLAYVSSTSTVAMSAIRDIKDFFLSDRDTELFGQSRLIRSSEQESEFVLDIPLPSGERKQIILKAFGQGTQLRGVVRNNKRPDILIFDDIESRETVDSPLQQSRLNAWALGTAFKAMAVRGVCIFIGNMLSDTSLLATLSKNKEWNPTVLGAIVRDPVTGELKPLWPDTWTIDALLAEYAEYVSIGQKQVWLSEMMNLTAESVLGDSIEHVVPYPKPTPDMLASGFIALDPAFGQNAWNDYSAITVHGQIKPEFYAENQLVSPPFLLDLSMDRLNSRRIYDEMMRLSNYWGITTWFIESVAAQRLLFDLFRGFMREDNFPPDLILMLPVVKPAKSKAAHIMTFRAALGTGSYLITSGLEDMLQRYKDYTPAFKGHDDDLDSGSFGLHCWSNDGEVIKHRGVWSTINGIGLLDSVYGENVADEDTSYLIP